MNHQQMLDYLGRVNVLFDEFRPQLTELEIEDVNHLIIHSEAPDGIRTLAWILEEKKIELAESKRVQILELIGGLVPDEHLPPSYQNLNPQTK